MSSLQEMRELYGSLYYRSNECSFISRSFQELWFAYFTRSLPPTLKKSIKLSTLVSRNQIILLFLFQIFLTVSLMLFNILVRHLEYLITNIYSLALLILGLYGAVRFNFSVLVFYGIGNIAKYFIMVIFAIAQQFSTAGSKDQDIKLIFYIELFADVAFFLYTGKLALKIRFRNQQFYNDLENENENDKNSRPTTAINDSIDYNHQKYEEEQENRKNPAIQTIELQDQSSIERNQEEEEVQNQESIQQENQENQSENQLYKEQPNESNQKDDSKLCIICYERKIQTAFYQCGHSIVCNHCSSQLKKQRCPFCRAVIQDIIKLYS